MADDIKIKLDPKEIIQMTVEAVREYDAKQKKSRHDRRLYNTRLLMKNYNALKEHCEKSVSDLNVIEINNISAIDVIDSLDNLDKGTYIESIKRSNTRTKIMIDHIDSMLSLFEIYCNKTNNNRKYRVLTAYYLNDLETKDISMNENIDIRTCQRDLKFSIEKLSALIFGVDGLSVVS